MTWTSELNENLYLVCVSDASDATDNFLLSGVEVLFSSSVSSKVYFNFFVVEQFLAVEGYVRLCCNAGIEEFLAYQVCEMQLVGLSVNFQEMQWFLHQCKISLHAPHCFAPLLSRNPT